MNVQRGFTLVELIAILIIVGIMSVFAIGRLSTLGSSTFSQRAFYDKVTASIEYARKIGVAQRRYVCVRTSGNMATFTIDTTAPEKRVPLNSACAATQSGSEVALPMAVPDSNCGGVTNAVCAPSGMTLAASSAPPLTFDATGANINAVGTITFNTSPLVTVEVWTGYVH